MERESKKIEDKRKGRNGRATAVVTAVAVAAA